MARKKKEIDKEEINEIIELYIKEVLNGTISKLSNKGVSEFNKTIAQNPEYKRKNGSLFTLYKYNIWAGTYNDEDCYGKARIKEIKKNNEITLMGNEFSAETSDINQIINKLYDKPELLVYQLTKMFSEERKKLLTLLSDNKKLEQEVETAKKQIALFDTAVTNFIYQSQSPSNSLNDMLLLTKEEDAFCYAELKQMFNSGGKQLSTLVDKVKHNVKKVDNVVDFTKKSEEKHYTDV